ncbi:MAG: DUF3846 domain-containing protein [Lachnospiraceae bacterium]|nr:DUF3846 domain-containing protein [Lachnospiraceae bacterium]
MQVLIVEPMNTPYVKEIGEALEDLQREVGGHIEVVYPFEDEAAIICNEEGKLDGLELNRALRDDDGKPYDVIAGTFLIAGLTEDSFGSLAPEQIKKYSEMYKTPELFVLKGNEMLICPATPETYAPFRKNEIEYEEVRDGVRLVVRRDFDPIDPRSDDGNFGSLVCFDKIWYGDRHEFNDKDEFLKARLVAHFGDEEKAEEFWDRMEQEYLCDPEKVRDDHILEELKKDHIILPIYLYRHGGDTVSTEPFSDPWDSGQIGWIYAEHAMVRLHFGDVNDYTIPLAKQLLENEVATWNDYIMDENYAYDLVNEQTGEIIDGGFWTGDIESLKAFAFNAAPQLKEHSIGKDGDVR